MRSYFFSQACSYNVTFQMSKLNPSMSH